FPAFALALIVATVFALPKSGLSDEQTKDLTPMLIAGSILVTGILAKKLAALCRWIFPLCIIGIGAEQDAASRVASRQKALIGTFIVGPLVAALFTSPVVAMIKQVVFGQP